MKLNDKNSMKSILNQVIWGPAYTPELTDAEKLRYGIAKPNTYVHKELSEIETSNEVGHETGYSKEYGDIEIIPVGLIIQ